MSEKVVYIKSVDDFNNAVSSDKLVVIDFYADWCGPCKMMSPVVDKLADEYDGKAVVCKCNVDENKEIAAKFGVEAIPTLYFIKDKKAVSRTIGLESPAKIKNIIESNL